MTGLKWGAVAGWSGAGGATAKMMLPVASRMTSQARARQGWYPYPDGDVLEKTPDSGQRCFGLALVAFPGVKDAAGLGGLSRGVVVGSELLIWLRMIASWISGRATAAAAMRAVEGRAPGRSGRRDAVRRASSQDRRAECQFGAWLRFTSLWMGSAGRSEKSRT